MRFICIIRSTICASSLSDYICMRWLSCQVTEEMERWHRAETADRECCLRWNLSIWSMKPLHILARDRRPWWRFNIWHTGISLAAISLRDAFKHLWAWNHWIFLTRVRCSRWQFPFPVTVSGCLLQDPRSKVQDEVQAGDRGGPSFEWDVLNMIV